MTDDFMSGWGQALHRVNKLIVECDSWEQAEAIEKHAKTRPEMKYINICITKPTYSSRTLASWKNYNEMTGWHK